MAWPCSGSFPGRQLNHMAISWTSHAAICTRKHPTSFTPREWSNHKESLDLQIQQQQETIKRSTNQLSSTRIMRNIHRALQYQTRLNHSANSKVSCSLKVKHFPKLIHHFPKKHHPTWPEAPIETNVEPIEPPEENQENPEPGDPDTALLGESIFWCQDAVGGSLTDPLHEWMTLQPGTTDQDVCIAEDDMPYLEAPITHGTEQRFHLEIPLSRNDLLNWSKEEHPEEMSYVAGTSKRARAEVQIKDLPPEERKLFDGCIKRC